VVVFDAAIPMKECYVVTDTNVIKLVQPGAFTESLTEILRSGARALLTQSVEAEVAEFLAKHAALRTETGDRRVVRHGHLPERDIMGRRFYHRCPRALRVHGATADHPRGTEGSNPSCSSGESANHRFRCAGEAPS
jgi:hypothetical protein